MKGALPFATAVLALALLCAPAPQAHAASRYVDEVFSSVDVTSNIAYGQAPDELGQPETLLLDVYQPAGDPIHNRPAVIFVHGGAFTGGSKTSPDTVNYVTQLAKRGFVSASISYRLREGGYTPEEQAQVVLDAKHDAQAAVRWFRANAASLDIDPERISIAGYSAGAATALFVAYTSNDAGDSGNPGYPSDVSAVIDISGGMGDFADDVMDAGEPPVLIVHSTTDQTVPYSQAEAIVAAAESVGVPYELHALQGVNHGKFGVLTDSIAEWSGVFLYHQLILGSVGGVTELAAPDAGGDGPWWWPAGLAAAAIAGVAALGGRRRASEYEP